MDFSLLQPGLHTMAIRVGTSDERWSPVLIKNILVPHPESTQENVLKTYRYWIDGDVAQAVTADVPASGLIEFEYDASALNDGMHTLAYQITDKFGNVIPTIISHFLKIEKTMGAKLVGIDYWFNDGPRSRIAIDPAQASIDRNDIIIPLDGLQPRAISDENTFNAETKTVTTKEDVTVGLEVFNDAGTGSEAVIDSLKQWAFTITPEFVALQNQTSVTKAAPRDIQMLCFDYKGTVGDSLYWEISGSNAKIDFFDASGQSLKPEMKTINEKSISSIKIPTDSIFVLLYGATTESEVTVKVAK